VSGYKPIGLETLYSSYALATTSVPAASAATITAGMPPIVVPAGYMANTGAWASSLRLEMGGLMSTAATIPTWNWGLYAAVATTTAPAFSAAGITLGASGAAAPPSVVTNVPWMAWYSIGLRTIALGAASTIVTWGVIQSTGVNTAGELTIPGTGAYTPPATWDTTQSYVLWPGLTLGAATAGNTITVQYAKLYGET
jgi:hypothetical protein